jgi:hypothetical protein
MRKRFWLPLAEITLALGVLIAGLAVFGARADRVGFHSNESRYLATVVAVGVFILSNPHLYPDPPRHVRHLFDLRSVRLEGALREPTDVAVILANPLNRPGYVLDGSLVDGTVTGSRGLPIEAVLATVGAVVLAVAAWRTWRRAGRAPAEGLVLLTVLAYFGGTSAALTEPTGRYYIPTLFLGTVLSGVGIGAIIRLLATAVPALRARASARPPRPHRGRSIAATTVSSPSDL